MRNQRTECLLGACGAPFFPDGVGELQDYYERLQLTNAALSSIAHRSVPEFWYSGSLPSTLDGTGWHLSLVFKFGKDVVLTIMFPFTSEHSSIAFYPRGTLPAGAAERVLEQLVGECKALQAA